MTQVENLALLNLFIQKDTCELLIYFNIRRCFLEKKLPNYVCSSNYNSVSLFSLEVCLKTELGRIFVARLQRDRACVRALRY